jgi:hypothetical protein
MEQSMANIPDKRAGWAVIADYIIKKESDGSWIDDASEVQQTRKRNVKYSFTQWGKEQAREIGISTFIFWQCRRAGMLYNHIAETTSLTAGIPLSEVSGQLNPENLNDLQKIMRVAPTDLFNKLCERVFVEKDIGRKELSAIWQSLRPALQGETNRGRNKKTSIGDIKPGDIRANKSIMEGLVFLELKKQARKLFGFSKPPVVIDVRDLPNGPKYLPDAVLLGTEGTKTQVTASVHAIEFCTEGAVSKHLGKNALVKYGCDYYWLIVMVNQSSGVPSVRKTDDWRLSLNPEDKTGIIEACIDFDSAVFKEFQLLKNATPLLEDYRKTSELLKWLCIKNLG